MNVRYAPRIDERLTHLLGDLHRRGADVDRFQLALESKFEKTFRFPQLGRAVPELAGSPFREFSVVPYRFFYYFSKETQTLWIVGIWHQRERVTAEPWVPAT